MNNQSQPKPVTTPISTIKEELRDALSSFKRNQEELKTAKMERILGSSEKITYLNLSVARKNSERSLDALIKTAEQNLAPLLESHDMLEAIETATQWIVPDEDFEDWPEIALDRWGNPEFRTSVDFEVENSTGARMVAFYFDGEWMLAGAPDDYPIYLENVVKWRLPVA